MLNHAANRACLDTNMKTAEQVRAEFHRAGQSITQWATAHGYPAYLVQQVLSGRARCLRGRSHEIAVLLQLKDGYIMPEPENAEEMP
jgi:gp16 family phage-associated protein